MTHRRAITIAAAGCALGGLLALVPTTRADEERPERPPHDVYYGEDDVARGELVEVDARDVVIRTAAGVERIPRASTRIIIFRENEPLRDAPEADLDALAEGDEAPAPTDSATRARLGIDVVAARTEEGALITEVYGDTPASRANLRTGDLVKRFAGQAVTSDVALDRLVEATPGGTFVEVVVRREGKVLTNQIEVPAR